MEDVQPGRDVQVVLRPQVPGDVTRPAIRPAGACAPGRLAPCRSGSCSSAAGCGTPCAARRGPRPRSARARSWPSPRRGWARRRASARTPRAPSTGSTRSPPVVKTKTSDTLSGRDDLQVVDVARAGRQRSPGRPVGPRGSSWTRQVTSESTRTGGPGEMTSMNSPSESSVPSRCSPGSGTGAARRRCRCGRRPGTWPASAGPAPTPGPCRRSASVEHDRDVVRVAQAAPVLRQRPGVEGVQARVRGAPGTEAGGQAVHDGHRLGRHDGEQTRGGRSRSPARRSPSRARTAWCARCCPAARTRSRGRCPASP